MFFFDSRAFWEGKVIPHGLLFRKVEQPLSFWDGRGTLMVDSGFGAKFSPAVLFASF